MSRARFVIATVLGIAVGGLAAAVGVVLTDGGSVGSARPTSPPPPVDPHAGSNTGADAPTDPADDEPADVAATPSVPLRARFDDPDPAVRHAVALEMLHSKRDVLPQVRALRPSTPEGRDLTHRLVIALQTLRAIRRGHDYDKVATHDRMGLWLRYAATVVPEELLESERLRYWEQKVAFDEARVAAGVLPPGDLALSRLELARVRFDVGELTPREYAELREESVAAVSSWIDEMRSDRRVAKAKVKTIEERLAQLTER